MSHYVNPLSIREMADIGERLTRADRIVAALMIMGKSGPADDLLAALNDARRLLNTEAERAGVTERLERLR